jgi:hypothetical protein
MAEETDNQPQGIPNNNLGDGVKPEANSMPRYQTPPPPPPKKIE